MAREDVPLVVIQRQLGHGNLGITSIYLQGIDSSEIIDTVHARRVPMIPARVAPLGVAARIRAQLGYRSRGKGHRRCREPRWTGATGCDDDPMPEHLQQQPRYARVMAAAGRGAVA